MFTVRLNNWDGTFHPNYPNKIPLLKVLNKNGESVHGGRMKWSLPTKNKPGEWTEVKGTIELCRTGLHLTEVKDVDQWWSENNGYRLFLAEVEGPALVSDRKVVVRKCRLVKELKYDRTWWYTSPEYATAYIEAIVKGLSKATRDVLVPDGVLPTTVKDLKTLIVDTKKKFFEETFTKALLPSTVRLDYDNYIRVKVSADVARVLNDLANLESIVGSKPDRGITLPLDKFEKYLGLDNFDMAKFLEATPEPLPLIDPEVTE
jgi:hypothetical protein